MARTEIDFGIDLGTTNSCISVMNGLDPEVFKNNEGIEYTPSAVWIDKKGSTFVGRRAKERLEDDIGNAFSEFKLQMGTDALYTFSRSGQHMTPEHLSAEVLKALKADVFQKSGEDVRAAVITVPAAFELPQCEATKRAAQLAGLATSPLLQEPVAAALAYGFNTEKDNVFWLVYDLGGGTFDAAVIQVRDGVIQVVNHVGDNHLGGKLIDWAIVDELLIPSVCHEYRLSDFRRGNPKWISAIAKLKGEAEKAKIRLSRDDSAEIIIDFLCQDDKGEPVRFEFDLRREDVSRLAEPFIRRSLNICKKVLAEKRLSTSHIERVILVGGPTQAPYLRDMLRDSTEGLGIELDFRVDPLTVVAQGAAIFARTQRLTGNTTAPAKAGEYALELDYKPMGPDPEPIVGGRVVLNEGENPSGMMIEFVHARTQWRSGRVRLSPTGSFVTNLLAERGKENRFLIELYNASGLKLRTTPDQINYTVGQVITDQPLIHSMGIAMANNETDFILKKGTPLPARRRSVHRTVAHFQSGQNDELLRIPVVEGEYESRANRNQLIGSLEIPSSQIRRDVPANSEVEITIDIDASRLVRVKAYIPMLDEEFEVVLKLIKERPDPVLLQQEVDSEMSRLEKLREQVEQTGDVVALNVLQSIERENMVHEVHSSLAAANVDRDAADKCQNRLLDLKATLDQAEDALEWPALLNEADEELAYTRKVVEEGNASDRQELAVLEREIQAAMQSNDPDLLRRKIDQLCDLKYKILVKQPGWWVGMLDYMEREDKANMRDRMMADQLFNQGRRAIQNNDLPGLQAAVRQLIALLPPEKARQVGLGGGTIKTA